MYNDNQSHTVEVPDSFAKVTRAVVVEKEGKQFFYLEAELRADQKFDGSAGTPRLHLTNGINHQYVDLDDYKIEAQEEKKGKK